MAHLMPQDKAFFKEHGYLIVRGALTQDAIDAALDKVWESLEEDRNDPVSWIRKGYRTAPIGGEDVIRGTLYGNNVYAMAEELVGEGKLNTGGGAGPHINFPDPDKEWREPMGHLDGYHTPTNGVPKGVVGSFTLGATLYLEKVEKQGGGFTIWPGSHRVWAEYFRYHDLDSLPGGIAPFDLGPSHEFTGEAGDVCFWHHQMSHTAGPNCGRRVRIALIGRYRRKDLDEIKFETPDDMWKYWEGIS